MGDRMLATPSGSLSTLMVNVASLVEASLEVARTDTEWLVAVRNNFV